MSKFYSALIISDTPIDLGDLSNDKNARHLVVQEFDLDDDTISSGDGGWMIRKSAPKYCDGNTDMYPGVGASISVAIVDWFKSLCRSVRYVPLHEERRKIIDRVF